MWSFLSDNASSLNLIVNAAMLLVWICYFQILYQTYAQQQLPNILINRGGGNDTEGRCIVSNMSSDPIYVQSIMVEVQCGNDLWSRIISDVNELSEEASASSVIEYTGQGPLEAGSSMDFGRFDRLVSRVIDECGDKRKRPDVADVDMIRVTVLAAYTAKSNFLGAIRKFQIRKEGGQTKLDPVGVAAKQITGRRGRRHLLRKFGFDQAAA